MPEQLRFFPGFRPLVERFPREFFLSIPKEPGVYLMENAAGDLIYVGKAKNLRNRVGSYRYALPGSASRKTVRLVHAVERIHWEVCGSELDAQLRENLLLRTHRPRFNRQNVYPRAYCYIALQQTTNRCEIAITRKQLPGHIHYGAFKISALYAMAALRRLLWAADNGGFALAQMPALLGRERLKGDMRFLVPEAFIDAVIEYLEGAGLSLHAHLQSSIQTPSSSFETGLLTEDFLALETFFQRSTSRNRALKIKFGLNEPIEQEALDDLLLKDRSVCLPEGCNPGDELIL